MLTEYDEILICRFLLGESDNEDICHLESLIAKNEEVKEYFKMLYRLLFTLDYQNNEQMYNSDQAYRDFQNKM
ncbi:MAG: hypothetical protein JXB49_23555 [Bacteroidales bacterium]|nr:hypothetical protein [Bacteroidales bacterium]